MDARHVLHDALLETFPFEYGRKIEQAEELSYKSGERLVFFFPSRLKHVTPRALRKPIGQRPSIGHVRYLFGVYENTATTLKDTSTTVVERNMLAKTRRNPRASVYLSDAVLVYRTRILGL